MGLTTSELDQLRLDALDWLTDVCNIIRKTTARDDAGGIIETWAVVGEDVPCAMAAQSMNPTAEQADGPRIEAVTQWVLTLPSDQDINLLDQVSYQGLTFEVGNVTSPRTNQVVRRAVLNLVA